jgi:hypothetical protein
MKGEYPPGTSRRDLKRAGIIDPEVHCPDCDASVKSEDHEDWCELKDAELDEIKELAAEDRMATEYDPVEHGEL